MKRHSTSSRDTTIGSGKTEVSETKTSHSQGAAADNSGGTGVPARKPGLEIMSLQLRMKSPYRTPPDVFMNITATSSDAAGLSGDLCHPIADDFVQLFSKWASAYDLDVQIENSPDLFDSEEAAEPKS